MTAPFLEIKPENFSQLPFDTFPLSDYVTPKNDETNKELPYCCAYHQEFYENLTNLFLKFPNCCDPHKEIAKNPLFKIENYQDIPDKILNQCSYTQHHIIKRIHAIDWYADITEYIEYNIISFGHPNIGIEHYFNDVVRGLKDKTWLKENNIPFIKAEKLLVFVRDYRNPSPKSQSDSSTLNVLFNTYQNWLKIFPFELSFFKELKPSFEAQLPFLKDGISYNRYLKISKATLHTKDSLIEFLLHSTNSLLSSFNSLEMFKDWAVPDADKIKLELIVEQRRLKINKGYHNTSTDEQTQYRKILKEWLKDEKAFIEDIRSLLPAYYKPSTLKAYKLKQLAPYMFDKDLPWFFDAKNIAAQANLVVPTYNYFNEGPGKDFFDPLTFLNLLDKQYQELINYLNKPSDFVPHLKAIPLNERESHILFGFIIKWFGGYPIESHNQVYYKILKMIEKEFLLFEGDTPEKDFCKADSEFRKKLMKLSITGTTSINTGLDWQTLYDGISDDTVINKVSFASFDEMFQTAYNNNAIGPFDTEIIKLIKRDKYNLEFNIWLQEQEGWSYADEVGYSSFLTKEKFVNFLQYLEDQKVKLSQAHRDEAATWVVNKNEMNPTPDDKKNIQDQKPSPTIGKAKPIFKPIFIATIFDLLKDFFNANQQSQLRDMLETGENSPEQLIFLDSGNRLADAFKQLKKTDIITGCDQKELEEWIYNNFLFRHRQTIKPFKLKYLNDIISTNSDPCRKPILNVKVDKSTGEVSINKT